MFGACEWDRRCRVVTGFDEGECFECFEKVRRGREVVQNKVEILDRLNRKKHVERERTFT